MYAIRSYYDHILDRRALDMGDVDPGARRQQRAEILDRGGGARHHLDGAAVQKGTDHTVAGLV